MWLLRRQLIDLLAGTVQRDDLLDAGDGKRHHVGHRILAAAEGHGTGQDVGFDQVIFAVESLERFPQTGKLLAGVHVGIVFVGEAALEFRALSGQFLGVEGDLLHTGRVGRHAREVRDPRCATQLAAAGSDAADASRFLPGADLFHFDADVKPLGEDLDQLAEVHALVGDVVEDRLDLVALVLHVADLHIESHFGGDLACGDHRFVLQSDGLLPAFDVVGLSLAVDFLVLAVVGGESRAAHLARHQIARERDDADVVAGRSFDRHDVAPLERQVVLEAHFENIGRRVWRVLLQPGCFVQFVAPLAGLGCDPFGGVVERAAATDFWLGRFRIWFGVIHWSHKFR